MKTKAREKAWRDCIRDIRRLKRRSEANADISISDSVCVLAYGIALEIVRKHASINPTRRGKQRK